MFLTKKSLIGVIHLPVLLGNPKFLGFKALLEKVERDRNALEKGGVDAIIIENTYDEPMLQKATLESRISFLRASLELTKKTKLPVGLSLLWNDYEAMFSMALAIQADFIRLSVFVDHIAIPNVIMKAKPEQVMTYREQVKAKEIKVIVDLQVKDCTLLEQNKDIRTSAKQALRYKPDTLIITGEETGKPPSLERINKVREVAKKTPLLIGSGISVSNLLDYWNYADGFIIGSSLKTEGFIDIEKVKQLVSLKKKLQKGKNEKN